VEFQLQVEERARLMKEEDGRLPLQTITKTIRACESEAVLLTKTCTGDLDPTTTITDKTLTLLRKAQEYLSSQPSRRRRRSQGK
jgi:hypothetical protein